MMEYAYGQFEGAPMVTLSGRFVYADAGKIHDIIAKWDFATYPVITFDMRFVTFVDSTAIGALFVVAKRASEHNGEMVLRNPSPSVTKTLERAHLPELARIVHDVAAPQR